MTLLERLCTPFAMAVGFAICEPKIRLGRRRHDGLCDECGDPLEQYVGEKLDFPLDDLSPEESTSREKLSAMWNAEYVRVCLECSAEMEADQDGDEQ